MNSKPIATMDVGSNGKTSAAPMHSFVHRPHTASQLFACVAPIGNETCFYCGGACEPLYLASKVVKKSFTGLDTVTLSDWVCTGCVEAMNEKADIVLLDGSQRSGQKVRGYSWVITAAGRRAATKSHREQLLKLCVDPPKPPFVICITDSGQKHLLYRAVVNASRDVVTVSLEGESITYEPSQLVERIELCKQIAAATGKPAMKEPMSPQSQMRIVEHFESEHVLSSWQQVQNEPLTRLAVWLCPAKDECLIAYPAAIAENAKSVEVQSTLF